MMELLSHSYFSVFLIIAIGILFGRIKFGGISLDISAVIFVALVFGHFGVIIPKEFQTLGLILFIYSIGIQAGPGFFGSFKSNGLKMSLLAVILIFTGAVTTFIVGQLLGINGKYSVGIFTGALTSTPGLAAAIESTQSELASIGYGIAYPFGVIGVILFVNFIPKIFKINIADEEKKYKDELKGQFPELQHKQFKILNSNVFGKTILELNIRKMTGANISRIKKGDFAFVATQDTVLQENDIIRAVGTTESLEQVQLVLGPESAEKIKLEKHSEVRWVLVSNKAVMNRTLSQLNIFENYDATITRIRRSGMDITPNGASTLKFGDKLLVASRGNMEAITKLLGNKQRKLNEADFLPISLGIVIGVLLGIIPLNLPGGVEFKLGITGGVLLSSLILSRIGKTGKIIWNISGSTNQTLRKIGLLFFLATIGTHAGQHLMATLKESGINYFIAGAIITIIPMFVSVIIGRFILKINFLSLLGLITGGMTSTPGLSAVSSVTESDAPTIAYATVYPIAMVSLIIFVKILANLFAIF